MAKQKANSYMTPAEQIGGTVFFALYLLVLPLLCAPAFQMAERLLGTQIGGGLRNLLYYYLLFAVTLVLFRRFLGRTTRQALESPGSALRAALIGLVALYGLNELVYRGLHLVNGTGTNLNDLAISAQLSTAPHMTALILVLLAPFVEEVLFRGLVFGNLRNRSRVLAYLVSTLLFGLAHVWQFAVVEQDLTCFLQMLQYLVPGAVLCWTYERSGTLWSAMGLHGAANALSIWMAI